MCDILDATPKGDRASMEHPLFSLSTKKDMRPFEYERGRAKLSITPSKHGRANIFDRDVLIYVLSQLMAAKNEGQPLSRRIRFYAHDLLQSTNRHTSGQAYNTLKAALTRLQFTQIETNIHDHGIDEWRSISFITEAKIVKESKTGRMLDIEVEIGEWLVKAVENNNVLTLSRDYFFLRRPLERRLYELARKHCGTQDKWQCGLDVLQMKCGSTSTAKEFRRLIKTILETDAEEDHMPDYRFELEADILTARPKGTLVEALAPPHAQDQQTGGYIIPLRPDTLLQARDICPTWDINLLVSEWRVKAAKSRVPIKNPDAAFIGFCKAWYKKRGRNGW